MDEKTVEAICWIAGVVIGSGLIEISPIKLNPWTWLFAPLRKALLGNLKEEVTQIKENLDKHIKESQQESADYARQRILQFNDEIIQKQFHSKEAWDQILECIDTYEKYCTDHPNYPNNKCLMAVSHIKDKYNKCLDDNSFLTIDEDIKEIRKKKQDE